MLNRNIVFVSLFFVLFSTRLLAQENLAPYVPPEREIEATTNVVEPEDSVFYLNLSDTSPRSTVWVPLLSFLLPGFGQYWEGDYAWGAAYTGTTVAGLVYSSRMLKNYQEQAQKDPKKLRDAFEANPNLYVKKIRLGEQVAMAAGSMSAYHSYRSAVRSYKDGTYGFLGPAETPGELLLAPFRFDFLTRSSTLWPLGLAVMLHYLAMQADWDAEGFKKVPLGADGAFYTGAYSFNAGVNEEAMFRGWLLPEMYVAWGRRQFMTKASNAVLFAAAHLGNIGTPLPQLLFGYYLSDLTMNNNWRISEAIFVHTWWDIFAFLTVHQIQKKDSSSAKFRLAPIALPLVNMAF